VFRFRIRTLLIATVLIAVVVVIVVGVLAVRTSLVAEENLQAFFHAHRATMEYVQQNEGQWPRSWDDLREVRPESDFEWVSDHLTFDFNASPQTIAAQTPDAFDAIQPNQPCYVVVDDVQLLIDTLKKYHEQNQ